MSTRRIKVLIIDDSALMRAVLRDLLARDPAFEVVGAAPDPVVAWNMIQTLEPDVLTLDVQMPKMDGLSFLDKLMRARPMPVVMVSALTKKSADTTLRALELGAVDFVTKPELDVARGTAEIADEIAAKLKAAARGRPRRRRANEPDATAAAAGPLVVSSTAHPIIAIGASAGGTEALREILVRLPVDAPGIAIVQHMPAEFTRQFAARLGALCKIQVREAVHGQRLMPGLALIAPGNLHMELLRSGAQCAVSLNSGPPVKGHRPAVNVLFDSCARELGPNAVGVILTGMGDDGASGLLNMRRRGARTIAQDENTSVVFGMPKQAIALGAVELVLPLEQIAAAMLR